MKRIVLFLLLAGTLAGFFACQNPLAPDTGDPAADDQVEDPGKPEPVLITPFAENDPVTGQAVFVSAEMERIAITSSEAAPDTEELIKVSCKVMSDYVLLDKPDDVPDGETWAIALVIGIRDDGKPGIWEIHNDMSVHPIAMNGGRHGTTELGDSDEREDGGMGTFFGWTYYPLMFSDDIGIIVGYAENIDGYTSPYGTWAIEPGTKVGVYWSINEFEHGKVMFISRAKVIATPLQLPFEAPSGRWGRYSHWWRRFWQIMENRFKLFFLTWVERYITEPETVEIADAAEGTYWIYGPDDEGVDARATVTKKKVLAIDDVEKDESDYEVLTKSVPVTVTEGEAFSFEYTVLYVGNVAGPQITVTEYLSSDNIWDPTDTPIRSYTTDGMMQGDSFSATFSDTINTAGTYYAFIVADPDNLVDETDETNNQTSVEITVEAPPPPPPPPNAGIDLIPGTAYVLGEVNNVDPVTVTVPIENAGTDPANGGFIVDVYILDNTDLDVTGIKPISVTVQNAIHGGSIFEASVPATFSDFAIGEGALIYVEVDTGNSIAETDETNNTNTITNVGGKLIGSRSFSVRFETFQTGDDITDDISTYMAIYRESDSVELFANFGGGSGNFAATTLSGLSSGDVLLVKVLSIDAGPYGFSARALNMSNPTNFIELTSNEDDPGEPDSGATVDTITGLTELVVGGGMSRFIEGNLVDDQDWFRVTIP